MISRLLGLLAALLTVGALLTSPAHAGSIGSAPTTKAPKVGQCRTMTFKVFVGENDTSKVVGCGVRHTAYTIAVPRFPSSVDTTNTSTSSLDDTAARLCQTATRRAWKGSRYTRYVTSWDLGFFIPTQSQLAAGARWIDCEIVIMSPASRALLPLPTKLHVPLLQGTQPDAALRCHNRRDQIVACSQTHAWRPVGRIIVRQKAYIGQRQFDRLARRCSSFTHSSKWLATVPSPDYWSAGYRFVICSRATTH